MFYKTNSLEVKSVTGAYDPVFKFVPLSPDNPYADGTLYLRGKSFAFVTKGSLNRNFYPVEMVVDKNMQRFL